jgi:microcystin-dependent protein
MSQPYVGEIRMVGFNFAPVGWMLCQGQLLSIANYETLFNLIGTTYGGDGQSTFALPSLASRVPLHAGSGFELGQLAGVESVTLTTSTIPAHNHGVAATTTGQVLAPNGALPAQPSSTQTGVAIFDANTPALPIQPNTVGPGGGSQPHNNLQPYLCITFILSLFGVYPSPN